jgi:hypothetical protein
MKHGSDYIPPRSST